MKAYVLTDVTNPFAPRQLGRYISPESAFADMPLGGKGMAWMSPDEDNDGCFDAMNSDGSLYTVEFR